MTSAELERIVAMQRWMQEARGAVTHPILADADDWPRHLYAKLGFAPVGGAWQFTKMAPQHLEMQGAAVSAP